MSLQKINDLKTCLNYAFGDNLPYACKQIENDTKLVVYRLDYTCTRICVLTPTKDTWAMKRLVEDIKYCILDVITLCIDYIDNGHDSTDSDFIEFACDLISIYHQSIRFHFQLNQFLYVVNDDISYKWIYTPSHYIVRLPDTEKLPEAVNRINDKCNNLNAKKSKKAKPKEYTIKTRIERVDDTIEQAIYKLLKATPIDVDAVVKLRSLF